MSQVFKRGPQSPQMNMTPLIDVTFQLIIFFMLVSNIVSEENVQMIVPKLERSQAQEVRKQERVVVNVAPQPYDPKDRSTERGVDSHLMHPGTATRVKVGMEEFGPSEREAITSSLAESQADNENVKVLLRADAALYYKEVQPVMKAIAAAKISQVNVVAYRKKDE